MPDVNLEDKPRTRIRRTRPRIDEKEDAETETAGAGLGNLDEAMDALPDDDIDFIAEEKPTPDFDGEQELLDSPRVTLAQRGREARATKTSTARSEVSERVSSDFADILEDLEFGVDAHKITVMRVEPEYDPETGKKISGLQGTFSRPISLDDIQQQFGGGTYRVIVRGPREASGRGSQIKAQRMVEIAGAPIPLPDPREEARKKKREEERENELVQNLLAREDKRAEEARRETMELRKELANQNNTVLELVTKMNSNRPDPAAAVTPLLEAMREESRRREEQQKLEMQRLEQQRKEEREEQRRRDEDARRQHELEMQRQQQQFQMQMKQLEMQMQAQQARIAEEAKVQQSNMNMMVQFLSKTDAEKEQRSLQTQQMQMTLVQQMNELQRTSLEGQLKLVLEQLKDAKNNKDDFFSAMEKFQAIRDFINPPEEDNRETWERVLDRVGEAVPSVMGLAAAARSQAPASAPSVGAGPGPRPALPAPGTMVVVDDIEGATHSQPQAGYAHEPPRLQAPASEAPETEYRPNVPAPPPPAPKEEDMDAQNPLTQFPPQYQGSNNEEVLTELVYRLDLAVQKDLDLDQAFVQCINPLPAAQRGFLKALPVDVLVSYIEENVPADWAIRSVAGEQLVRDLHDRLNGG